MSSEIYMAMKLRIAEILSRGEERETRDTISREILGSTCTIDPNRCLLSSPARYVNLRYVAAEILWYLSGSDLGTDLRHWAPNYARLYADVNGVVPDAYGARFSLDDLQQICWILGADNDSRRAFLSIWKRKDLEAAYEGTVGVPCCIGLHFLQNSQGLTVQAMCRSSDLYRGFPNDVFTFCFLGRIIAARLNVQLVKYIHFASTLHIYEKEEKKLQRMYNEEISKTFPWKWDYEPDSAEVLDSCGKAGHLFKRFASGNQLLSDSEILALEWAPVRDLLLIALSKVDPRYANEITSPMMKARLAWEDALL